MPVTVDGWGNRQVSSPQGASRPGPLYNIPLTNPGVSSQAGGAHGTVYMSAPPTGTFPTPTASYTVPVTGWGLTGSLYTTLPHGAAPAVIQSARSEQPRRSARRGAASAARTNDQGVYTVQSLHDGAPLGFSFERFENGPPNQFSYAMRVAEVAWKSWAEHQGIEAGDTILTVNGEDVSNMKPAELEERFQKRPFNLALFKPRDVDDDEVEDQWTVLEANRAHQAAPEDLLERHVNKWGPDANDYTIENLLPVGTLAADIHKAMFELQPGILKMFPSGFLLFCLAVYIMPIFLVLYVGEDHTSKQFFPHITPWVLVLPILYIFTYFAHVLKGGPSKFWIVLCLIGSGIVLLIISDILLLDAYEKSPMFSSTSDCGSWGEKRKLQEEWNTAATYYAACIKTKASDEASWPQPKKDPDRKSMDPKSDEKVALTTADQNFAAAVADLRIQDCDGYDEKLEQHPDWAYLEHLEVYEQCGGWCTPAPPLWRKGVTMDPCSVVVSTILTDKVGWALKQVTFYTVFALVAISTILMTVPPVMKRFGVDW